MQVVIFSLECHHVAELLNSTVASTRKLTLALWLTVQLSKASLLVTRTTMEMEPMEILHTFRSAQMMEPISQTALLRMVKE
jgi:hypothetical protein